MHALATASEGLMIIHGMLLLSFLLGSALFPWCESAISSTYRASAVLLRTALTTGFGLSVVGFIAFGLAAVGLFRLPIFIAAVAVVFAGAPLVTRKAPVFSTTFWRVRLDVLGRCWSAESLVTYVALVLLCVPAIVPNPGNSDPVGYHLVYADEWVKAGKLVIDPFLRLPFYASNFVLLFSVLMMFGAAAFVNFLSWGVTMLAALAIVGAVGEALAPRVGAPWRPLIAVLLAVSTVFSPALLRWVDTAYIDPAIGAFALFFLLCVIVAASDRSKSWLMAAGIVGGFFIGMKGSFIAVLPVCAIALILGARQIGMTYRSGFIAVFLFVLAASPWYIRNTIEAGDPIPPVLNIAIYGRDGLMSKSDWQRDEADFGTPKSPAALAALPFSAFFDPRSEVFREYGTTAIMLLLWFAPAAVLLAYVFPRHIDGRLTISALFVFLLAGYWGFTSSLLRYAAIFYPSIAIVVVYIIALLPFAKHRSLGPIATLVCCLLIIPSPGSREFFHDYVTARTTDLLSSFQDQDQYNRRFGNGYAEASFLVSFMRNQRVHGRVYELGLRSQYDFEREGIEAIGDWLGPASYFHLYRAIDAGAAVPFLDSLQVKAVVIDPDKAVPAMDVPLERELVQGGYCSVPIPGSKDVFLVSLPKCGATS